MKQRPLVCLVGYFPTNRKWIECLLFIGDHPRFITFVELPSQQPTFVLFNKGTDPATWFYFLTSFIIDAQWQTVFRRVACATSLLRIIRIVRSLSVNPAFE